MNKSELLKLLREKNLNFEYDVIYKKSTGSTNDDAKKSESKNNLLIVAEEQTAGKGRYGRSFYSKNNGGLYFTLKINNCGASWNERSSFISARPTNFNTLNIDDITFFPLIAALSVSRSVSSLCGIELSIKWPNDLLYKSNMGYRKVCGILTEASILSERVSYVIVGIGLNVNNDITDFPEYIKNIASSLKIISGANKDYSRAEILCEIIEYFTRFLNTPRNQLLDEYQKRLLLDINISFTQNGSIFKGRAKGINENGNLIAVLENGEETTIQSGEINFI